MTVQEQLKPYVLAPGEGQPLWFLGSLMLVKATGAQTGGAFALVENLLPAGFASPYHLHHVEDEAFYVLEGEMTFFCGGEKISAGPGSYVFGPRGIPHGFRVEGTSPARMLLLAAPAGFDQFVIEMSEPAKELRLPDPVQPDMQKLMALAAKYKMEVLGPLPE
jgi:quercetin dioxygenase-like cupin family protein